MKKVSLQSSLSNARAPSKESITSQRFFESQSSIKISYFWGADDYIDAIDWIDLFDLISTDYNWTATNKITRLGGYLRKHALVWYVQTIKSHPIEHTAWTAYKDMFIRRFSKPNPERTSSSRSDASSVS